MEISLKNFISFVMEQPTERMVDHSCGFSKCAIGDFTEHIGKDRGTSFRTFDPLRHQEKRITGASKFVTDRLGNSRDFESYGSIQEDIKQNYSYLLNL
jgi:hypothetical protein